MSATISFGQIPQNWNVPGNYAEVKAVSSGTGLSAFPLAILIIGPMLASGRATPLVPVSITSGAQADGYFGVGSALALACRAALLTTPTAPISAIAISQGATWTAATGAVVLGGAPTSARSDVMVLNGTRVSYVVDPTQTAAAWAANLIAAANQVTGATGLIASATANVAGGVTFTSVGTGAIWNDWDIRRSSATGDQVPGLTVTVTDMANGAGVPDITGALSAVQNTWWTDIISCFYDTTSVAAMAAEGKRRFNAMAKLDTQFYIGFQGTYAQWLAYAAGINSQFVCPIPAQNPRWSPPEAAAAFGAAIALRTNNDPSQQMRTVELVALNGRAPESTDLYTPAMQNVLLSKGASTFDVAADGTVTIQRAVTSYQTNAEGNADTSWMDVMAPKVATRIRYDWDAYCSAAFPNYKLADPGSIAAEYAANTVTTLTLKASWAARCTVYEKQGWIENSATYAPLANFVRNPSNRNRVDCTLPLQRIGSLFNVMSQLQFEV